MKPTEQKSLAPQEQVKAVEDAAQESKGGTIIKVPNGADLWPNGVKSASKLEYRVSFSEVLSTLFRHNYTVTNSEKNGVMALAYTCNPLQFCSLTGSTLGVSIHFKHKELYQALKINEFEPGQEDVQRLMAQATHVESLFQVMTIALKSNQFAIETKKLPICSTLAPNQLQCIAQHYWLSSAFCNRVKNAKTGHVSYSDFIAVDGEKAVVLLGEKECVLDFKEKMRSLFPEIAGMLIAPSKLDAPGAAMPYNGYEAVLLVNAFCGVMPITKMHIKVAEIYNIKIKAVFLDRCDEVEDKKLLDTLAEEVTDELLKHKYSEIPVICGSGKTAFESKTKDSEAAKPLQELLGKCGVVENGPHTNYFGLQIKGAIVWKYIARQERSAMAAGMRTPWANTVNSCLIEMLCCMRATVFTTTSILPDEVQDIMQCWYLSKVVQHPFTDNGAEYPPLITLDGGVYASRVITQEWGQVLWGDARS